MISRDTSASARLECDRTNTRTRLTDSSLGRRTLYRLRVNRWWTLGTVSTRREVKGLNFAAARAAARSRGSRRSLASACVSVTSKNTFSSSLNPRLLGFSSSSSDLSSFFLDLWQRRNPSQHSSKKKKKKKKTWMIRNTITL